MIHATAITMALATKYIMGYNGLKLINMYMHVLLCSLFLGVMYMLHA